MRTPKYSVSQKIGNLGERVFVGGHPDTWTLEGVPRQGGDFGFDQSMWFEELGHIAGRFSVQLKAGASPKFTSWDDPTIPVDLSPEVCNLYLQDGNPVLLVFVALESESSSENAKMYYLWIEEELPTRLKGREVFDDTDPDKMRFHVPVSNRLTKKLDITEHLKEYWNHTRMANRLRGPQGRAALNVVSSLSPKGISALTASSPSTLERRLINESMSEVGLWSTPNPGTTAAKIKQISDFITQGNATEADRLIAELRRIELSDPHENSALSFQEGRRQFLDGDPKAALGHFSRAAEIQPESASFFSAELEAAVAAGIGKAEDIPTEILAKAERFSSDPDVQFQLVRISALKGKYVEAEEWIAKLDGPNKRKAQTLYYAIRNDWRQVIASAELGLSEELVTKDRRFLELLRVRGLLNIVIGDEEEISVGGRPNLDVSDAVALRDATLETLKAAQDSGWPANSEMLLDCAAATAVIFGQNPELLAMTADFAKKRPRLRDAQEVLARIATFMDEPDVAVAALRRLDNLDSSDVARLVLLLSESGKHSDAVDVALKMLVDSDHSLLVDMAVGMAAMSAYRLGLTSEEAQFRDYVSKGEPAARSLLRFISDSTKSPENLQKNIDQLWADAISGDGNETLQDNLLLYLRPDREEDVERIIELAQKTRLRRSLTQMESAKFSAALLRHEKFAEVVEFTDRAQELFPDDENIGLTRAIALDKLGQSSAAEFSLRRFEGSSRQDLLSARSQLLVRIGEVNEAISLVQRALSTAKDHSEKFSNQRILATLYSRVDQSRYVDAVWRLGEIADQEVESEEGTFLVHFVMATSGSGVDLAHERIEEFQARVQRFTERFPKSKVFRVGEISEGAPAEEILANLREISGFTDAQARAEQRDRTFGERSGSHIPFAFRPRRFAPYAMNIVDLLKIVANAWHRGESSRVIVGDPAFGPSEFNFPPIIDLTTLFALVELDLFDKLFDVWTAVAVPQVSLGQLAELMFEPLNPGNIDLVDKVALAVRRHRSSIVQPRAPKDASPDFPSGEFETIRWEASNGRFDYLAFDLASAAMLTLGEGSAPRVRTIWDFIRFAESKGVMTRSEVLLARLRVSAWNSQGVPLESGDIAAASLGAAGQDPIPDDNSPTARAVQKFIADGSVRTFLDGSSKVLIELAKGDRPRRREAADWFARLLYLEVIIARSTEFKGTTDEFTAQLATLVVRDIREDPKALELMQFIWQVLEQARSRFGGSSDRDDFYRLIGVSAANLFDKLAKKHGIDVAGLEALIRELLFSMTVHGTHDRSVLEDAYFKRTLALQG